MTERKRPTTRLARHTDDDIFVRGKSLVHELMGRASFTEAMFLDVIGRMPNAAERAIVDAVLVTLMEHGLTPSAISARLVAHSSPEAMQAAIAAGLLAVGSQFVGTIEDAAKMLARVVAAPDGIEAAAKREIADAKAAKRPLPGFGHHLHKPDDPRTPKLFAIARANGVAGRYIDALERIGTEVDRALGKHLTINATGAVAAVLLEIGIAPEIMRGFAVVARAAGLLAHVAEERAHPTAREIWERAERAVPYDEEETKKR